jgi:aspartate aminotransferase
MTGWRVGFAFASPKMIAALSRLQSHCTTGTSIISQWAAFGAFERADEVSEYVRNEMKQRRDICVRLLKEMLNAKIEAPASGLYLFLPVEAFGRKESSEVFCKHALENSNAILVPGVAFGEEGYVRLSFAGNLNQLESGMLALKKCILDIN